MYERFTDRARRVMKLANQEAQQLNHEYIGTEHILLGLVNGGGVAATVLNDLGIDLDKTRDAIKRIVQAGPDMIIVGRLPLTPLANEVIELAMEEARSLGDDYLGTEHILLGLLASGEDDIAKQILAILGADIDEVRREVIRFSEESPMATILTINAKAGRWYEDNGNRLLCIYEGSESASTIFATASMECKAILCQNRRIAPLPDCTGWEWQPTS